MDKRTLLIAVTLYAVIAVGSLAVYNFGFLVGEEDSFGSLTLEELRELYITERDFAIRQAEIAGLYDCCIRPSCTMCFDLGKGHEWSLDEQYCSCYELLLEEEECPQCRTVLTSENGDIPGNNDELPDFVTENRTVQDAYLFTQQNQELTSIVPCFCACYVLGHQSVYDCFFDNEGNYDPHGANCKMCINIAIETKNLLTQGYSQEEIVSYINENYG